MRVLIVAAHPDDEVLGCGGTMARHASEGDDVHVLILGEGATSRDDHDADDVRTLADAAQEAGRRLGARSVSLSGLPDNRFDTVPLLDVVKLIEARIAEHSPQIVYTQHGGDVNVDHRRTFEAVLAATRPQPGHPVREVLSFPVASSTEWAFGTLSPAHHPNVFVDITAHLEAKLHAMGAYADELRDHPHPRSLDALRDAARTTGAVVGVGAAEGFNLVRTLR